MVLIGQKERQHDAETISLKTVTVLFTFQYKYTKYTFIPALLYKSYSLRQSGIVSRLANYG